MHVLYLHQYFVPPDGGGGTRSYEFARRLVQAGHRVSMITSSAGFPDSYALTGRVAHRNIEGIELQIIRAPYANRLSNWRRILVFLSFAFRASAAAARVRSADVIFATSTPLTIGIPALYAKWRLRRPMVFEVRDLWPELPIAIGALRNPLAIRIARWFERLIYRHSERVIALSPGMRDGIAAAGYPVDRIAVIPNASDVDLFRVPVEAAKPFLNANPELIGRTLVVYAGTIGPVNGVEYLARLAAAVKLIRPDVVFVVVGDGREKSRVLKIAEDLGVVPRNFLILPPLLKRQMPGALAAATIAASVVIDLEPMRNNSANKLFDAFAAGRPVLINYGGWQAELLERTGAGISLPHDDLSKAATDLVTFLESPTRMEDARQAARALADNEFNRDRLSEQLRTVLETVAAEAGKDAVHTM